MAHPLICCPTAVILRAISTLLLLLASATFLVSQNTPPQSDPQAVALAQQAIAVLTNGVAISDVTLTGNVTWTAGSDAQMGTGALLAKGVSKSRIDLSFTGSNRRDIRNSSGSPQGVWIGPDGVSNAYAPQNCWTDTAWYFPALSSLTLADPSIVLSYVGSETRAGTSVHHLRSYRYVAAKSTATTILIQQQSTVDYYFDTNSLLPISITFNAYSDDDIRVSFPVEIDFSNYQTINGAQIPMHIQKSLNGGLVLDIIVTGVTLNSGLSDQLFAIP